MPAKEHIIPVFVPHLGCPHNCVFCNQNSITGEQKPATGRDVERIVEAALSGEVPENGYQIAFYGGSFTAIPASEQEELLSAAYSYVKKGVVKSIRLSTRPDAIDGEILTRLEKYGVTTVELGVQSLDDTVLLKSGRGHSAQVVYSSSELIKKRGFRLIIQMMTGLPGDTKEKSLATARKIISIHPDGVRIYPTVIIKNTPLYELYLRGTYREHTVEEAVDWCAEIVPLFNSENIPIIRLGLNPTDDLSAGEAAAGAYHPALGELVKSRILYNRMSELLSDVPAGSDVKITVGPRLISQAVGQHRKNISGLIEKYQLRSLRIISSGDDSSGPELTEFSAAQLDSER